jgi:MFS family permease
VAIVMLSIWGDSPPGFFLGTFVAGVGFGAGFQGGIRLVAPLAEPGQRAGVLSVLYTIVYVGLAIPAIGAGVAVVRGGGLVATSYEYCLGVIILAVAATINLIHLPSTETSSTSSHARPDPDQLDKRSSAELELELDSSVRGSRE